MEAFGKQVAKDRILLDLLPSRGRGKYLIPDFQDLTGEYLASRPGSDERQKLIANRSGMTTAIYEACLFLGFVLYHPLNFAYLALVRTGVASLASRQGLWKAPRGQ